MQHPTSELDYEEIRVPMTSYPSHEVGFHATTPHLLATLTQICVGPSSATNSWAILY